MIVETYSVSQPHRDAILICIIVLTLLGCGVLTYRYGWKALPGTLVLIILTPLLVIGGFDALTYKQGLRAVFDLGAILPLCLISLPPALLGIGVAISLRRLMIAGPPSVR